MAILRTYVNHSARGSTTLELKPNSPSQREMVDTYALRLWVHNQLVYDRTHSVRDWQMRHFYVENIARAFCCIRDLIGKEISYISDNANDDENGAIFISRVCAHVDTEWLQVVLSAASSNRSGDIVHINLYLQQAETQIGGLEHRGSGQWGEWSEIVSSVILCKPDDAIAFGTQLLEEIHAVEQERISLGILKYDNPSYSE